MLRDADDEVLTSLTVINQNQPPRNVINFYIDRQLVRSQDGDNNFTTYSPRDANPSEIDVYTAGGTQPIWESREDHDLAGFVEWTIDGDGNKTVNTYNIDGTLATSETTNADDDVVFSVTNKW